MKGFVICFDDQAAHRLSIGGVDGHEIDVDHLGVVLVATTIHRYFTRSCRLGLPGMFLPWGSFAMAVLCHC